MYKFFTRHISLVALICMVILCANGASAGASPAQRLTYDSFTYNLIDGRVCGTRYQGISDHVVIPEHLDGYPIASIGDGAFMQYSFVKSVTILPNTVSIGSYAFYGCSGLTSVIIPQSVKFIGERAFEGCANLTLIVAENSYAALYAEENGIPYIFAS